MVQVGYNQRRSGKTFYLYRDIDMMAYQRIDPENPNSVVFGWMFRPVLGKRSVSMIKRQLYAVLALPHQDAGPNTDQAAQTLDATVKTYWKKYDAKTMTSFLHGDANEQKKRNTQFLSLYPSPKSLTSATRTPRRSRASPSTLQPLMNEAFGPSSAMFPGSRPVPNPSLSR